jgi:hypothetical protein
MVKFMAQNQGEAYRVDKTMPRHSAVHVHLGISSAISPGVSVDVWVVPVMINDKNLSALCRIRVVESFPKVDDLVKHLLLNVVIYEIVSIIDPERIFGHEGVLGNLPFRTATRTNRDPDSY